MSVDGGVERTQGIDGGVLKDVKMMWLVGTVEGEAAAEEVADVWLESQSESQRRVLRISRGGFVEERARM